MDYMYVPRVHISVDSELNDQNQTHDPYIDQKLCDVISWGSSFTVYKTNCDSKSIAEIDFINLISIKFTTAGEY